MEFSPLIKGTPDWNEKYNQDIGGPCAEMDAARSEKANKTETVFDAKRRYQDYTTVLDMVNDVSDDGTVIAFGDNQSALFNAADRPPTVCEYFYFILSDGLRKNVVAFGFAAPSIYMRRVWNKAWSTEWTQVGIQNINGLLAAKADKNNILQTNLYAQFARDVQAPGLTITPEILFNNPPLDSLALLDHRAVSYLKEDKPAGAPPTSNTRLSEYWDVLTSRVNRNRSFQFATQGYAGDDNGRVFLRTRHRDNDNFDYTQWQAWKEVATCYCDEMEWKALPMANGWVNANSDPAAALKYRKGADGKIIYVEGYIKQPNTLTNDNRTFAYLPENYRPKNYWWTNTVHESKEGVASIRVNLNGQMYVTNVNANTQAIVNSAMPVCLTIPI